MPRDWRISIPRGARRPRLAATCAATLPATAEADDGLQPPIVATPDLGTLPALDAEIDRTLADAISAATGGNAADAATDASDTAMETSAQDDPADDAAPASVDPDSSPRPPDATQADSAPIDGSPADTTSDSADTAGDSAASGADAGQRKPAGGRARCSGSPRRQPPASPDAQLNVNLNVRVSSPGSNGAVTQLNAATTPAPERATTDTTRGEQAAPPTAPRPAAPPASVASDPVWYWEWNCVSDESIGAISPSVSRRDPYHLRGRGSGTVETIPSSIRPEHRTSISRSTRTSRFESTVPATTGPVTQANVAVLDARGSGRIAIPSIGAAIPARSIPSTRRARSRSRSPQSSGSRRRGHRSWSVSTQFSHFPPSRTSSRRGSDWATAVEDAVLALDAPVVGAP